ncbi:signal recognition particle-docking protein FtsY [Consotaella aegiceratis]|uniref:signal recognition particle-docking protein FtsY n=1 Tax=Consotaella aegiceratis TaxID=3097961 RepID=UPI002F426323
MAEKTGFFRRIFSFGSDDQPTGPEAETTHPVVPTVELPAPTDERAPAEELPLDDASAPALEAIEPVEPGEPAAAEPVAEEPVAEEPVVPEGPVAPESLETSEDISEPAPDAVAKAESEADFSWLEDASEATEEPSADFSWLEQPVEPADETVEAERRDELNEPVATPVQDVAAPETSADEPADEEDEPEADFSWLDAPLPPEEEEDAPAPDDAAVAEAETTLLEADGGVARIPAEPLPAAVPPLAPIPEDGWRRRAAPAAPVEIAPAPRVPWYQRLRQGLARSSDQLSGSITALFTKRRLDEDTLQDFEDVLIQADLGVETAMKITDRLSEGRFGKEISGDAVRSILAEEVETALAPVAVPLELNLDKKPHVVLVVGVNGTGKTTTIGKLAAKLTRGGLKVTLCAGDTFRAAAVEQLKIWGERTGSEVIAKQIGADAAGLAFEAYDAALANGSDVLIIDTAGRLQNKAELMAELEKIVRVLRKREPDAPHTVLQTLDATTGQNALSQVEIFRNVAGVNGLVMTKLDGTARGGILVAIAAKHKLPVYFVGVGEGIDDLEPFKARDFAQAIAGLAG